MGKLYSELSKQITIGYRILKLTFESSPKWATVYVLGNLLNSVTPAITLIVGKRLLDQIVNSIGNPSQENISRIVIITLLLFCTRAANSLFLFISQFGYESVKDYFAPFVMQKVYHQAASLDLSYFDDPKFYDKIEKVQREIGFRPVQAMYQVVDCLSSFAGLASLALIISSLSFWAPIILVLASLPYLIFQLRFSFRSYSITDVRSPENRKIWQINYLLTGKNSSKEIKVFNLHHYLLNIFKNLNLRFIKENRSLSQKQNIGNFLLDMLAIIIYLSMGLYTAFLTISAKLTIGDYTMITVAISQFQGVLGTTINFASRFYENNLFLSHYFEFMDFKPNIVNPANPVFLPPKTPFKIEFKNVFFGYDPKKPILKNLSFTLNDNINLALVGENGAGKSTIVKLILRLYDVTSGKILINGTDIRDIDLQNLRNTIGVVFQDFGQYEVSAKENIAFGDYKSLDSLNDEATLEKIKKAARLSGASEFIENFPEKYDTLLGRWWEKGEELSGGQWQKIALARAFFNDHARLLIMDEPTSAQDPKSEFQLFKNLITHTKNKSLILISHRFSTVRLADEIIVLHEGKIIEQGNHKLLMKKNGHYARLYNLQAKWYK